MNDIGVSLSYRAGESVRLRFTTVDADGNPADITDAVIRFVLARRVLANPVASTEESPATAAAFMVDAVTGIYEVTIDPEVTAEFRGSYRFESWLEDVDGGTSNPAHGHVTFERSLLES